MLTLVLAIFCSMPSNSERVEILRDAMVLEGFTKAQTMQNEYDMLDMAAEYGYDIGNSEAWDGETANAAPCHECY